MNKSELTVHELVDCYLEEVVQPRLDGPRGRVQGDAVHMRPTTACVYRNSLRKHIVPKWGTYAVSDFEKPEIWASVQNWLDCLVRSETNHVGLTPLSVRRVHHVMRRLFKFAVQTGHLAFDPFTEGRGKSTMCAKS
jgi:hypothetical protein